MTRGPKIHVFPNGLRLVYESPSVKLPQTHIRAFCNVGSIYEPISLRGASHFIEHMCFKGSTGFPSWVDVAEPFNRGGAFFNAVTTKQYTCFIVDCLESHVNHFLKIVGDMILRSTFDRKEYNLECNVVREEMEMKPQKSFIEDLVLRGSAYSIPVDNIAYHAHGCLPYDEVIEFYRKYYVPQNMVISIVSSIPFETILRYITDTPFVEKSERMSIKYRRPSSPRKSPTRFSITRRRYRSTFCCADTSLCPHSGLLPNSQPKNTPPILHPTLGAVEEWNPELKRILLYKTKSSRTSKKTINTNIATVEIGINVCDQFNDFEHYCLTILQHIIYNTKTSRLFTELREKRGLTYRSGAYINLYETCGVFVLYAISDVNRLVCRKPNKGVVQVMFDILDDLAKNGITDSEFKLAKQHVKESMKMESIAEGDKSVYNGIRVMLHNDTSIMTTANMYDKYYKHITKHDINMVVEKYFAARKYYLYISGDNLPKQSVFSKFLLPQ